MTAKTTTLTFGRSQKFTSGENLLHRWLRSVRRIIQLRRRSKQVFAFVNRRVLRHKEEVLFVLFGEANNERREKQTDIKRPRSYLFCKLGHINSRKLRQKRKSSLRIVHQIEMRINVEARRKLKMICTKRRLKSKETTKLAVFFFFFLPARMVARAKLNASMASDPYSSSNLSEMSWIVQSTPNFFFFFLFDSEQERRRKKRTVPPTKGADWGPEDFGFVLSVHKKKDKKKKREKREENRWFRKLLT